MESRNVLIIGGTRFIGPFVVKALVSAGHAVTLFNRGQSNCLPPPSVRTITGDRAELKNHAALLCGVMPDVVLDMIPVREQDALDAIAVFGGVARRVVCVSSQDVYRSYGRFIGIESGPPDSVPLTEDSPVREKLYPYRDSVPGPEHRLYHYDKIPIERAYLSQSGMSGTVLRYPMVYGPGDYQHRLYPYLKRMDDGRPAIVLDESMAQWRCTRGYVEDIAAATALAVADDRASGRVYNLGEPQSLCEADWARAIGEAAGWRGRVVAVPGERLPEALRVSARTECSIAVDTSRVRAELGFAEMMSRTEALRRTIEWERRNPPPNLDAAAFDYAVEDAVLAAEE